MRKSSRFLGADYGLTAQEMNYVLKEQGYLEGKPGDYTVTEKGAPFAEETDYHRGNGGYAHYNRYWTTRSWDENIESELEISDELKAEARSAVAESRKRQWDEIKAARDEANANFLASQKNYETEKDESSQSTTIDNKVVGGALIIGGLIAIGYGIYKAVPHVVNWWKGTVAPKLSKSKETAKKDRNLEADSVYTMVCPACGGTLILNKEKVFWRCHKCDYALSNEEFNDNYVFWFCDNCEAYLNKQLGFNIKGDRWTCTECGYYNDITDANID